MNLQDRIQEALAPLRKQFDTDTARKAAYVQSKFELATLVADVPGYGRAVYYLGVLHALLGESEQAVKRYTQVLNMGPMPSFAGEIYYNLGTALVDLDRPGADSAFELAADLTDDPELASLARTELAKLKP